MFEKPPVLLASSSCSRGKAGGKSVWMQVKKINVLIEWGFGWLGFGEGIQGTHNTLKSDLVSHSLKDKTQDELYIQILAATRFSSKAWKANIMNFVHHFKLTPGSELAQCNSCSFPPPSLSFSHLEHCVKKKKKKEKSNKIDQTNYPKHTIPNCQRLLTHIPNSIVSY